MGSETSLLAFKNVGLRATNAQFLRGDFHGIDFQSGGELTGERDIHREHAREVLFKGEAELRGDGADEIHAAREVQG